MKIGNRSVLLSQTMIIPDGEVAEIVSEIAPDDILQVRIQVPSGPPEDAEPDMATKPLIRHTFKDGWFEWSFFNFSSALGHSTNGAHEFGSTNAREPLTYLALIYKLKGSTKIELQVMIGDRS